MGLDMYLYGIKKNKKDDISEPSSGEWEEVCYWRKANAIHKWFNTKFIKEQDPWGYYEVEEEDIQGLLLLCKLLKTLKENPNEIFQWVKTDFFEFVNNLDDGTIECADLIARVLLPPDNLGCFFGSGMVDDWYWENIDDTIEQLTKALEGNYNKFFYMASW